MADLHCGPGVKLAVDFATRCLSKPSAPAEDARTLRCEWDYRDSHQHPAAGKDLLNCMERIYILETESTWSAGDANGLPWVHAFDIGSAELKGALDES
jgi:hypothetical protein